MAKQYSEVAKAFASALVENDFALAEALLTPELRKQLSSEQLQEHLYAMFRGYADGEPQTIYHDEEFDRDEWPAKQPGDVGRAYIGIEGEDFVEAVTVTVAEIGGRMLIRDVEWGRP